MSNLQIEPTHSTLISDHPHINTVWSAHHLGKISCTRLHMNKEKVGYTVVTTIYTT